MSAIHQALQKAEQHPSEPLTDLDYNPLASHSITPKQKSPNSWLYWALAILFIALVPVVLFWPTPATLKLAENEKEPSELAIAEVPQENNAESTLAETTVNQDNEQPLQATLEAPPELVSEPPAAAATTATTATTEVNQKAVTETIKTEEPPAETSVANTKPKATPEKSSAAAKSQPTIVNSVTNKPAASEPTQSNAASAQASDVVTVSAQHWQSKVETHIANGDIERAESVLKQWISASPNDDAPRIWLARIYISNNLYRPAETLINEVNSNEALALKGVIYEKTQRFMLAAEQFSELFNREPDSGRWLIMWAVNTENSGQQSRAIGMYKAFIDNFNYEDPQLVRFAQQRLQTLGGS